MSPAQIPRRPRRIRRLRGLLLALPAVLLAPCGGGDTTPTTPPRPTPPPAPVATTVTVSPSQADLASLGQTVRLTAQVKDQNGAAMSGAAVSWSSSAAAVAAVDATGLVTAAGNGAATITARSGSASGTASVRVEQVPRAIAVGPPLISLSAPGDTASLRATATDANGQEVSGAQFEWSSADETVATVDGSGLVTAAGFGSTDVAATIASLSASALVDVSSAAGDRVVLAELYRRTGGDSWTKSDNWMTDAPLSDWAGVATDDDGRVIALELPGNNLVGPVPPELGNLARLEDLYLEDNGTRGPIPPELGKLKRLEILSLGDSDLEGPLPPELGGMPALRYLYLARTRLSGPIPRSFANLKLDFLYYSGTGLCLPSALVGWLATLQQADDIRCAPKVTVSPPTISLAAIGDTARLTARATDANGEVVSAAQVEWTSADTSVAAVDGSGLVTAVDFGSTQVTAAFESASASAQVDITSPGNDRAVLEELYNQTGGADWTRKDNWLTDAPLSEWAGVDADEAGRVVVLELQGNNLAGPIPPELGDLAHLEDLYLEDNGIRGRIPPELGKPKRMEVLSLGDSELEGPLPPELGGLPALRYLYLSRTSLSGPIPQSFADLKLENFYYSGTGLCLPRGLVTWLATIQHADDIRCVPKIAVSPSTISFAAIGDTARLTATVTDYDGKVVASPEVEWSSADTSVATVDASGLVTAAGYGSTEVAATFESATASAQVDLTSPGNDRAVLEELYNRTGGADWTRNDNWLTDAPLSDWAGVETNDNGRVAELGLRGNNLRGWLPAELGSLDQLEGADLSENQLRGRIPAELGQLKRLESLLLGINGLEGPLPPEMGSMSALRTLYVARTSLSGPIPKSFASLRLNSFSYASTGLCLPRSLATWLATIQEADDIRCAPMITVNPPTISFAAIGDTARLTARVTDAEGEEVSGAQVEWGSADESVATVDGSGLVTAAGFGATAITATHDSLSASAQVDITSPAADRAALEALYRQTGGDAWTRRDNWMTDAPLSQWWGVRTNDKGGVVDLRLRRNNLAGELPAEFGSLSQLGGTDLSENKLRGRIPPEIGRLGRVRVLLLGINELEGPLPSEMGDMSELRYLTVDRNNLSGPVPQSFGKLRLDAFFYGFTGLCVPSELAAWLNAIGQGDKILCVAATADRDALVKLYESTGGPNWTVSRGWLGTVGLNTWHGVTVNADGYVTALDLFHNNLAGELPAELGDLEHLERLNLLGNALTGRIPPQLSKLQRLRFLSLDVNALEGPIPGELGDLAALDTLYLSYNQLTGPIPPELGKLSSLKRLSLFRNRLSGPVPGALGQLTGLRELWLSSNQLEGPLPAALANMTALRQLHLHDNRVTGSIPPEWGNFASLREMRLRQNRISGGFTPELGKLASLALLDIANNQLTGPLPSEIEGLDSLEVLWLEDNNIGGPLPAEIGGLARIRDVNLDRNDVSGPLPPELGRLATLDRFNAIENRLSGPIPPELGGLRAIRTLIMANNQLTGPLPSEIGDLEKLEWFDVANNEALAGLVPRRFMDLNGLGTFYFDGTGLCAHVDERFQQWMSGLSRASAAECSAEKVERLALTELHDRAGGASWTSRAGWTGSGALGGWAGVTVSNGRVTRLELRGNGLRGPLVPEIGNLTGLQVLDLRGNDLAGGLPATAGSMSQLQEIRVADNSRLAGPLPFSLAKLRRVQVLQYGGTKLCASPAATFQGWLGGIATTEGGICGNLDAVQLSVPVVYLAQSVQSPDRGVRLVANREALLRVFVTSGQAGAYYEPKVRAAFMRGGRETYSVTMTRPGGEIATEVDESDLDFSYNAEIPAEHIAPGVEIVVEADPDSVVPRAAGSQARFPATGSHPLDVVEVPAMEVVVVPVVEEDSPDPRVADWTAGVSANSHHVAFVRNAFPFSEFSARARDSYSTSLDITTSNGQWALVLEMEALRISDGATGYYYGAARSVRGQVRGRARLGGWASIGKLWDLELAHEVGHSLNLLHAPCGGPEGLDPDYPHANGGIGVWGYDFRDGTLVAPGRRKDIMAYCYERGWISDYFYEKIIDHRDSLAAPGAGGRGPGGRAGAAGARTGVAGARTGVAPTDALVLWGGVLDGELRIEPAFSMRAAPLLPGEPGPYRLEGVGAGGATEFSLSFAPGEDKFGDRYFFFTVPVEPGWEDSLERIVLTGPEGSTELTVAERRPISVATDPASGRIRAILRDWDGEMPEALRGSGVRISTTGGLRDAVRLRR